MNKIKSLLLTVLAVIALSSCNNEIDPVIDGSGENVTGYITLDITSPQSRTAAGDDGTEAGDDLKNENDIKALTLVLADSDGKIKTVIDAFDGFTGGKTTALEVPTGNHYVYAFINLPDEVTHVAKDGNVQEIIKDASAGDITGGFKAEAFFMVNAKHDAATSAGEPITITAGNIESNPAKAKINVDRVVAKINPVENTPGIGFTTNPASVISAVEMSGYHILNVNKEFNTVQEWGTANKNSTALPTITEALQTPLYVANGTNLVAAQYFHNIGDYTTLTKDPVDETKITGIEIKSGVTATAMGTPIYTSENRPTILETSSGSVTAGQGETTGVIYKVKATTASTETDGTFFEYRGIIYLSKTALKAAYIKDFSDEDTAFDGYTVPQLRTKGIKVYEGGFMYYTYFIRGNNSNSNHKYDGENYYGVFRNSVYNLTVNNLTKVGDDVPGGGKVDPEEPGEPGNPPIDADEAYIEVTVEVNPWVLNDLGFDL